MAPLVAPAVDLAAIGVILACLVCIGLLYAYKATFGALLLVLADTLDIGINLGFRTIHPFHFLKAAVTALDNAVLASIGGLVAGYQWAWRKFVNFNAYVIAETGRVIADLAEATQRSIAWLIATHIPAEIAAALRHPLAALETLRRQVQALAATVAHLPRTVTNTVTHETTKIITHVERIVQVKTETVVRSVAPAISTVLPRLGRLEREASDAEKWAKRNAKTLTVAGITGLLIAALARVGLTWPRCSNSQRYGKAICGMDVQRLESLIAETTLILGTVSLVEFAEGMQGVLGEITPAVRKFWRAT